MVQERSDRILPISEQEGGIPQSPEEYPPSAFPLHFPATVAVDSRIRGKLGLLYPSQ
jgi:hypothetical protein